MRFEHLNTAKQQCEDALQTHNFCLYGNQCWESGFVCFLGLLDPDRDPLVRGTDQDPAPDPEPSIIKQK
jgi:hypothetical protein